MIENRTRPGEINTPVTPLTSWFSSRPDCQTRELILFHCLLSRWSFIRPLRHPSRLTPRRGTSFLQQRDSKKSRQDKRWRDTVIETWQWNVTNSIHETLSIERLETERRRASVNGIWHPTGSSTVHKPSHWSFASRFFQLLIIRDFFTRRPESSSKNHETRDVVHQRPRWIYYTRARIYRVPFRTVRVPSSLGSQYILRNPN